MKTNFDPTATFSVPFDRDFNHPESNFWFRYRPGEIKDAEF
jgi:hypothetical protein